MLIGSLRRKNVLCSVSIRLDSHKHQTSPKISHSPKPIGVEINPIKAFLFPYQLLFGYDLCYLGYEKGLQCYALLVLFVMVGFGTIYT